MTALIVVLYGKNGADPKSRQALFFGHPEIAYLQTVARELATQASSQSALLVSAGQEPDKTAIKALEVSVKESLKPLQKNLRALAKGGSGAAGLESALFGRMVTSDTSANVNAPVHVAHAFTVHGIEQELDYVTAVDDLRQRSEDGESEPVPVQRTPRSAMSVIHGRLVWSLATNRNRPPLVTRCHSLPLFHGFCV